MLLGIIGAIAGSGDDDKADKQYEQLIQKIEVMKEEPITVENFEQKVYDYNELIWVTNNEYSSHDKQKKDAFEKAAANIDDKLYWFYVNHKDDIDKHYGRTFFDDRLEEDSE